MNSELSDQLTTLITQPLEMVSLFSVGSPLCESPATIDVDCHPGTPLVFTFAGKHVVFHCQNGATVGIDIVVGELTPAKYFTHPPFTDEEDVIVQMPITPFLDGPHGNSVYNDGFVDSLTLIHRSKNEKFDGIAAAVFEFHDSGLFAFSAAHESHFCYAFNNYCRQLLTESAASPNHKLQTLRRSGDVTPTPAESVLWMVD